MQRRNFLKTMVVLASVAAVPAVASTVTQAPNKYKEALRLFDLAVAASHDEDRCNSRMDELFVFLRDNFPVPEFNDTNKQAMRVLLKNKVDVAGIRGIPPNVADEIYPVALTKMALTSYRLPIIPNKMQEFDWFHQTYGNLVIGCHDA